MKIKLIKFKDNLIMPVRAHYNDAGIDCFAQDSFELYRFGMEAIDNETGAKREAYIVKIPLGFGLEIPDGYQAVIKPRSSMNAKGIISQIGTIDSGYRGEIAAIFINLSQSTYTFKRGDKICQIVVEPVILAEPVLELENNRGIGGFGSTGR